MTTYKGKRHHFWKGDSAGYSALHMWIRRHYGSADHCEDDPTHQTTRFQWANISGSYLRDRGDYKQLCPSCHKKLDLSKNPYGSRGTGVRKPRKSILPILRSKEFCSNNHKMTLSNLYLSKGRYLECRVCRKASGRKFEQRLKLIGI